MDLLDNNEHASVVAALQVAKEWGVPPLTVLAGRPNHWRLDDTLLARALSDYEATRVNEHGFPKRLSEDRRNAKRFTVDDRTVDYAVKAMDEWQARQEKSKRQLPPGVRPRIRFNP